MKFKAACAGRKMSTVGPLSRWLLVTIFGAMLLAACTQDKSHPASMPPAPVSPVETYADVQTPMPPPNPSVPPLAANTAHAVPTEESTSGAIPLVDMTTNDLFKGEDGGLYGKGRNAPPEKHFQAALAEAKRIQPLDSQGKPDPAGKIVMLSIGMSNTTQEFQTFMELAQADPEKVRSVLIVDGAQGGKDAERWSKPGQRADKVDPWEVLDERLQRAGVSPQQVQVAWIKQARSAPRQHGEFPGHARELQGHLSVIVQRLKQRYQNVRIAYLSSRIYAGYAATQLNPEPYAYESAFSVRWLIEDQLAGKPELNYDPKGGEVKAPLLLWGPYLWANGLNPRSDGLIWERGDLSARDGTHPSGSGREKVARMLLDYFTTNELTRIWFTKPC